MKCQADLVASLKETNVILAQIALIQKQRADFEQKNMIQASDVTALINDYNAVVLAKAGEDTALATAQTNLATAQAQIAEFNDPALQTALSTALANAAAATPPATPVVAPPVPVDPNAPVVDPNAAPAQPVQG